ncbi:MAG: XRE family transcriptional regulator [Pseudomonadota bacterium]
MFNPSRLEFARKRRGLTKKELASKIGLTPRSISMFENNESPPADDTIRKLSLALAFPQSFFSGDDIEVLRQKTVSFRSMSRMSASKRDAALSSGAIAFMFNRWIEQHFTLPEPNLIEVEKGENPEAAAMILRQHWGVGELPIRNVIHLLEAKGIRVFSLSENTLEVDAYSLWEDGTPFIFLNTIKSAERSKFDAAHELGHLILHKHGAPVGQDAEREADQFASAFLMPRSSVLASTSSAHLATLSTLIKLKKKWGVSLAALSYRMHKIGLLSDWHYRTLCIEISQKGYNKNEPEGIEREHSKIWEMVFSSLREDGITKEHIARELDIHTMEIESLVFGLLLMNVIHGSNNPSHKKPNNPSYLHVVK